MKMLRDDNKAMSAKLALLEDNLYAASREATPTIYAAVKRYITPLGAVSPQVSVSIPTGNTVEGEYEVAITTTTTYGKLDYAFRVPMKAGAPVITETNLLNAFHTAFEAQKSAPVDLGTAMDTQAVNLKSIEAERQHDLVLYGSAELPEWSFIVTVDALKEKKNHTLIASQIVASVRGHVLATQGKVAKFAETSFELPAVKATEVKAAAKPAELHDIPGFSSPKTVHEIEAEVIERNMVVHGYRGAQAPSEAQSEDESTLRFQAETSRIASTQAERFIKASLKGDAARITGTAFTAMRRKSDGSAHGNVLVSATYYGVDGETEVELAVPFENGKVVAEKIAKSPEFIKASLEKEAALKVLTAEEAKARFEDFKARQASQAEDMLASGLAVSAADNGMGQNLTKTGPASRIPVMKALLPDDVKVGGKVLVGSFVYAVADTDYNSVSAEKSAFYMLCLTDEVPSKDLPSMGIWGSLGGF
jgi:hypothetical protein